MRTDFALAWRLLYRDWKAGELKIMTAALVIAVASVGSVGFFADRVKAGLAERANLLLGADLRLSADRPLPEEFIRQARQRRLETTESIQFRSMTQKHDASDADATLVEIKAVADNYPLRGEIVLVDPMSGTASPTRGIPPPGTIWVDARLASRLQLRAGDRLSIGETALTVAAVIKQEPEVSGSFLNMSPKLMMNLADVPATNLLQPGNRATYRLFIAGAESGSYRVWAQAQLRAGQRIETIRDLRPEVQQTLERAEKFLGLAALVAVILAAAAMALAASRYLRRHFDACAMLRCFGASERETLTLYVMQFMIMGVVASAVGCLLALGGQQILTSLLGYIVAASLPWPGWQPVWQAFATGLLLLLGFALPPLLSLSRVPPLRVLRRDLGVPRTSGWLGYLFGGALIAALIWWQAREVRTGAYVVLGVASLLVASFVVAWLLLFALRAIPQRGYNWRYGLANLRRRPLAASLQIGALGLGMMALLLLTLVRGDLMQNWQSSLPRDAPNAFIINIQPDQVDDLAQFLTSEGYSSTPLYPMIRGRLVAVNGQPVSAQTYVNDRARRLVDREFNLSWSDVVPAANRITAGEWWSRGAKDVMSLEEGIAQTLGIKLYDRLTYDVAGQRLEAQVTSLRKVDWASFRVNFFALFPSGVLDSLPASYIAAFRVADNEDKVSARLVQAFPNILLIDVAEIMREVEKIIAQVSRAVEFVFFFTLAAGLLVLQAAIAATQDERRYDAAILRTLGASRKQMRSAQLAEFLLLGALAGVLAAAGASALGYVLADRIFQIPYRFNATLWLIGFAGGAIGVAIAGYFGTRSTLKQPPLVVIRQLT